MNLTKRRPPSSLIEVLIATKLCRLDSRTLGPPIREVTYQRLVNTTFVQQIGHTMEVYVDDMLTKSFTPKDHLKDLWDTFNVLKKYKMRLSPIKYAFVYYQENLWLYSKSKRYWDQS